MMAALIAGWINHSRYAGSDLDDWGQTNEDLRTLRALLTLIECM